MKLHPIADRIPNRGDYLVHKEHARTVMLVTDVKKTIHKGKRGVVNHISYYCYCKIIKFVNNYGEDRSIGLEYVIQSRYNGDFNSYNVMTEKEAILEML